MADGRHAIEFLDGSLWPQERAGIATPVPARTRQPLTDTENSILHSFTDTARRLLAAFTATHPGPAHSAVAVRSRRSLQPRTITANRLAQYARDPASIASADGRYTGTDKS